VLSAVKARIFERAVIVERVDENGEIVDPRGAKRVVTRVAQELAERGVAPPWAMSREECQAFWSSREDDLNAPVTYATKPTEIVDFLNGFWSPEVAPGHSLLELGCNAGTNLNRLRELGFEALRGIEINARAIEEMERIYPELAGQAEIVNGSLEDALTGMPDDSVDVVFTMAVLIHLHPKSVDVFREMVRVARSHVCVVELETTSNSYVFPRNYRRLFERLGCIELRHARITPVDYPDVSRRYDGYVARLFRVPG
jgi:SAM-dependent methyltransferase